MHISVVIPVFNAEKTLPTLVERLESVLGTLGGEFEVVLVEDGGVDRSWEVIQGLAQTRPWLRGLRLMRNYGQHNALLCGLREARFPTTVTMDDDLQHTPEEIPKLLAKLAEGYDVVYGVSVKAQHGLWRNFASWSTKLVLQNVMGAETARQVGPFRALRTDLRKAFTAFAGPHPNLDVMLTWASRRFATVEVVQQPRQVGRSNYNLVRLITHALNMVTGFSAIPLRIATLVGFFFALCGLALLAYVLVRYFSEGMVIPGFTFLASMLAIFSGVQLFALGIIGEYLARIHYRTMDKPSYTVAEDTNH